MRYGPALVPDPETPSAIGKGWWPIVEKLHKQLLKIDPDYKIGQIKEKFGGLRYYYTSSLVDSTTQYDAVLQDQMQALVRNAVAQCAEICEICGDTGSLREYNGWVKTLCEPCDLKRRKDASIS